MFIKTFKKKYVAIFNIYNNKRNIFNKNDSNHILNQYYKDNNNIFKSFDNVISAKNWLEFFHQINFKNKKINNYNAIFCDASYQKNNKYVYFQVVHKSKKKIFFFSLYYRNFSNNFSELIALFFSLVYAVFINKKILYIFSDSKLVIFFWSINIYNINNIKKNRKIFIKTVKIVYLLRIWYTKILKKNISFIDGKNNIADFGYHQK